MNYKKKKTDAFKINVVNPTVVKQIRNSYLLKSVKINFYFSINDEIKTGDRTNKTGQFDQ